MNDKLNFYLRTVPDLLGYAPISIRKNTLAEVETLKTFQLKISMKTLYRRQMI